MKSIKQEMHEKLIGTAVPKWVTLQRTVSREIYKKVLTISDKIFSEVELKIEAIYNDEIT